jgi:hypothetical protein
MAIRVFFFDLIISLKIHFLYQTEAIIFKYQKEYGMWLPSYAAEPKIL